MAASAVARVVSPACSRPRERRFLPRASYRRSSLPIRDVRLRASEPMKPWWELAPLPSNVKNAAKEIEYFGGTPLQRLLPWLSKPKATPPGRPDASDDRSLVLFDFSETSPDADPDRFARVWGELNDVVMGGRSEAFATIVTIPKAQGGSCAKLSGYVEGEGGGFASARTRDFETPLDLGAYDGVRLRVRGDGRRYKLILRDTDDFFALSWHAGFDTVENEWVDVEVPFEDLVPVSRAEAVGEGSPDARAFRRGRIFSIQLMFSKYEMGMAQMNKTFASGPFALEVASVKAFARPKVKEEAIVRAVRAAGGAEEATKERFNEGGKRGGSSSASP